ncbi:MAG TPA: signal peptidase I [Mucilaginibacter sp.]|nr:signal peptidase I [Mucilaginibacter sp.]
MKTVIKYVLVFAVAIVLAAIVRYYYLETYLVQSISMNNTLIEGDKLMITKTKKVHSGDVLIFLHNQGTYVKRLLGLPGDTIQIIHGMLYVNHRRQSEKYIRRERKSDMPQRVDPAIMNYYGKN